MTFRFALTAYRCLLCLCVCAAPALAQSIVAPPSIGARVVDDSGAVVEGAALLVRAMPNGAGRTTSTDSAGMALLHGLDPGRYRVSVSKAGFRVAEHEVLVGESGRHDVAFALAIEPISTSVTVVGETSDVFGGLARLKDVQGTSLFAGKKTEVLVLDQLDANLAVGNTRQVFAKVPGTNIWENDGSGLQIGISNRGLDPNRSWEMNSRQNGYDITADIFGYPEAYFTPPLEAVERVEVVRGSASLQYGAQFGGLVNYVLKKPPAGRRAGVTTEQTVGSNGLVNSHNRFGGSVGKLSYNSYYHHREASGWRPNSRFENNTGFASLDYRATDRLTFNLELTKLRSLVQMAGGLTDAMFAQESQQSLRGRNWFSLDWFVPSFKLDYAWSPSTQLSVNAYALRGQRYSLFNAAPVVRSNGDIVEDDPNTTRTQYDDRFRNHGVEVRVIRRYSTGLGANILAAGVRYYRGKTARLHGQGFAGSEPQFGFSVFPIDRDLHFTNTNWAGFAENMFRFGQRLTVTPGWRLDLVRSTAHGPPIVGERIRDRVIPLAGVGATYDLSSVMTLYGNITQAYRATLFNDYWRPDPTIIIDPALKDMKGHVAEFGWRGRYREWLSFDLGGFRVSYGDRLGLITFANPGAPTTSMWTNVSDSRNRGFEMLVDADLLRLAAGPSRRSSLIVSSSLAAIDTKYLDGNLRGNRVEMAAGIIARNSVSYRDRQLSLTVQHSHVGDQFTDASNTLWTIDGVQGLIPAYQVWDATASYQIGSHYTVRMGVNNITDHRYFTRRATSYPGPGLIPADGRSLHVTFGFRY